MRKAWVVFVVFCLSAAPAMAHSVTFTPYGWSGAWAGGGVGSGHPEDLCKNFASYVCMVAAAHTFGVGLGAYPIDFWVAGQGTIRYTTNSANTRGWIVVISTPNRWYNFRAVPGSFSGQQCDAFDPGQVTGNPTQTYGASRYYYQSSQNGYRWGPVPCQY